MRKLYCDLCEKEIGCCVDVRIDAKGLLLDAFEREQLHQVNYEICCSCASKILKTLGMKNVRPTRE